MKGVLYVSLFILLSLQVQGQAVYKINKLKDTKWDSNWGGGDWGDTFKMKFSDSTVTISCGPNIYSQFKYYKLKNDTLIIGGNKPIDSNRAKNCLKYYTTFKVDKIDSDSLHLKALNWKAVYVTGTLTTPYIDVNYNEFIEADKKLKSNTDFSQGGVVNDHLHMFNQKKQ